MNQRIILSCILISILIMSTQSAGTSLANRSVVSNASNAIPIVNSPDDIVYNYGETGNAITWEISDDDPSYWVVLLDDALYDSSPWENNNETVVVDIDGLDVGVSKFTILASDGEYNVSDTVLVTVLYNDLTPHDPFSISSDAEWASLALSEGWEGNGTELNPYFIENYIIEVVGYGIQVSHTSVHFLIEGCAFVSDGNNWQTGILMYKTANGEIHDCMFSKLYVGSNNILSENITWALNVFSSVSYGIKLQEVLNCSFIQNEFYTGGVDIYGYSIESWNHLFLNNYVNEKPLGYFNALNNAHLDASGFGQIILTNSTNSWIEGGVFDNVGVAVQIGHSYNCRIWGAETYDCTLGIYIEQSDFTQIFSCWLEDTVEHGMQFNMSENCVILNSNVTSAGYSGIFATSCFNISLYGNTVTKCTDVAVLIYDAEYSNIYANRIEYNDYIGIELGGCSYSWVSENKILYNAYRGIHILWTQHITIYANDIGFNGSENAYDDGSNNEWDDGVSIGNRWSDYNGSGYYYIPGTAGSIDHYPEGLIGEGPSINHPVDLSYIVGTTGHYITWSASSLNPNYYSVYKDGHFYAWDDWDGSDIIINVDGLSVGSYAFKIDVVDSGYHNATDTVIVTVNYESSSLTTNTTTTETTTNTTVDIRTIQQITLIVSVGFTAVIVIILVVIARNRSRM